MFVLKGEAVIRWGLLNQASNEAVVIKKGLSSFSKSDLHS